MFERFSNRARKVMAFANQESLRLRQEYVGPEHVLIGLLQEGNGVGAHLLKSLHFDLIDMMRRTRSCMTPGSNLQETGSVPRAPQVDSVIQSAIAESRALGNNYVGTEHLLLALLHPVTPPTIPNQIFEQLGLTLPAARASLFATSGIDARSVSPAIPLPVPNRYQTLIYQGAITLLAHHYTPPLHPDQIAQSVRDAQQLLEHVMTNTTKSP